MACSCSWRPARGPSPRRPPPSRRWPAYHDLRWLFAGTESWLWFAMLIAAVLAARAALDVLLLRLAWPAGVPAPAGRPRARLLRGADRSRVADAAARGHAGVRRRRAAVLLALPRRVPAHAHHAGRTEPRRGRPLLVAAPAAGPCGGLAARQLRHRDRRRGPDQPPAGRARASRGRRCRPGQRAGVVRAGLPGGPGSATRARLGAGPGSARAPDRPAVTAWPCSRCWSSWPACC